jgi:serine/threonine-protein kinase RsbW
MKQPRWTWKFRETIPSELEHGRCVVDQVVQQLRNLGWPESDVFAVRMSLEEAVVNAIKHGNQFNPEKLVRIDCRIAPTEFRVDIEDEGAGFDPCSVPDCTADENLDKPSGRGLHLMKHFMTRIEYRKDGKRVLMEKRICESTGDDCADSGSNSDS